MLRYHDGIQLHVTNGEYGYVLGIYEMTLNNQKTYLINDWSAGYTALHGQGVHLYQIKDHQPKPTPLIKTKQGLVHSIDFSYEPFTIPDEMETLIGVNAKKREFHIPIVIKNDAHPNGQVTKRTLRYRYNGKHFAYLK